MDLGTIAVQRHQRLEALAREREQRVEALGRATRVGHIRAALKRRIADEPSARKGTDMSQHAVVSSQGLDDRTQVVKLAGEFDLGTTPKFEQAIDDALDSGRRNLVVDLRSVSFLDATLLNALVRSEALLRGCGRRFALVRPCPRVWRLFVLTGLNRALPIFAGMSEAVESFQDLGVVTTASGW